jgi:lipopolysaccharide export system permease protein
MKTLGLSLYRLLAPVFAAALLLAVLAFLFTDRVVPEATFRYHETRDQIRSYQRSDGSRRQVLLQDVADQLIFARTYDAAKRRADEISYERLEKGRLVERLIARHMSWQEGAWVLLQGHSYRYADSTVQHISFDTLALDGLALRPEDFARQQRKPEEMDYAQLSAYIARATASGEDATRHRVDLHLKISFPLTSLVTLMLGATLGANARRAGLANSFGLGVLICFAYYSCVKAGQALGWNGLLSPWLGAWIANLLFGALALLLLWRAHK